MGTLRSELAQGHVDGQRRQAEWQGEKQRLQDELAALNHRLALPSAGTVVLDLFPYNRVERSASGPAAREWDLPANDRALTLLLNASGVENFEGYSLELADAGSNVLWKAEDLARQPSGAFTLSLPSDFLSAGSFAIQIYGQRGKQRVPLQTYRFRIAPLERPATSPK